MSKKGSSRDVWRRSADYRRRQFRRLEGLLGLLGLAGETDRWDAAAFDWVWRNRMPPLRTVLLPSEEAWRHHPGIEAAVRRILDETTLDGVPLGDVFALYATLGAPVPAGRRRAMSPAAAASLDRVRQAAYSRADELLEAAQRAFEDAMGEVLMCLSRPDGPIASCRLDFPERRGDGYSLHVNLTPARTEEVVVDGKRRGAYRAGIPSMRSIEARWPEWKASELGGEGGYLPVLIQGHAIRRLRERLPLPDELLNLGLYASLVRFVIAERRPDGALVAFEVAGRRLGHLVVTREAGYALVKTFLFLTMSGTPESRALHDRLRLRRADIEYQRLDEFSTLVFTDILTDPELAQILADCGCGGLIGLLPEQLIAECRAGVARELRDYLGMQERGGGRVR